ncbi:MAG: S8 family peptidase [Nocardioides sp.]
MPVAPRRAVRRCCLGAAALALAVSGPALVGTAPVQAADGPYDCLQLDATTERVTDDSASVPYALLGIPQAQRALAAAHRSPGGGVAVAVVDSGIATKSPLVHVSAASPWPTKEVISPHGTVVAGLIAAGDRDGRPTGIAPDADLVDVRVYDGSTTGPDNIDPDDVAAGLDWVADHARALHIKVANVSLAVPSTPALRAAVHRVVHDADVVVVAASGNRPTDETDPYWGRFNSETGSEVGPGEDAASAVFPAGYPDVVAVSATRGGPVDPSQTLGSFVLPNSQTDVAAPTFYGVSVGVNGSTCRVVEVATSFAAAEVSGVVALLRSMYPTEHVAQIVARLENTASGTMSDPTKYEGHGIVQPYEALTRPLEVARDGAVAMPTGEDHGNVRATPPARQADVLASTRDHAVWWGLLGGGALLLVLMLRPVLARRRD